MAFVHGSTLQAVESWLHDGQDVLVHGDVGSGRSTVLDELFERLRSAGTQGVLLHGSAAAAALPLAAFQTHLRLEVQPGRRGMHEATHALADAVRGGGVVLLDDLHRLDMPSLAVVAAVVDQVAEPVRLVASVPQGIELGPAAQDLMRRSVLERVEPLDVGATAALLADVLGGPVEIGLATDVAGRAGGNPRAVAALAEAARHSGALARAAGRWTQSRALDTVPADAVLHGLLGDLPPHLRDALDTLAWFGLVDLADARRLLGDDVLDALSARGRLALHDHDGTPTTAVSPPALAHALRLRMSAAQRAAMRARLGQTDDALGSPAFIGLDPVGELTDGTGRGDATAQTVGLMLEAVRTQASLRRATWEAAPTVTHALPLLRLGLLDDVRSVDVDGVLSRTLRGEHDSADDVATYALLRAQWVAARGGDLRTGLVEDSGPSGEVVPSGLDQPFLDTVDALHRGAPPPLASDADLGPDVPEPLRAFVRLMLVQADVEAGAVDSALDRLEGWQYAKRDARGRRALADQLDATRGDVLLMVGQVDDALAWARDRFSVALDRLDAFGVRLAVRGLATAQLFKGDDDAALRTVGVALRLGRTGPTQAPYDERVLGLAAALHARRGELDVARSLLEELERTPRPFVLPFDVMRPWARMEVGYAATRGAGGEADALWLAGEELLDAGRPMSALLCWLATPAVLGEERLGRLERLALGLGVPSRSATVALHVALVRGSAEDVVQAAAHAGPGGPLVEAALDTARRRAAGAGRFAAVEESITLLFGARRAGDARPASDDEAPLTEREAEIVALAREGLTNRQIASRLFLSVRTVESHLYRAMRKLGVSDRTALRALARPAAAG